MKKLLVLTAIFLAISCQKTEISELERNEGRNAPEEKTDSTSVTPSFDINGWEGAIDAGFEFG